MPRLMRAAARQLMRPGARTGDSGTNRRVQTAATTVASNGSQNSQCQLRCSTMSPDRTMPMPPPTPRIADSSPMLPATFSRGNSSRTIPNANGKMPPLAPWIARARMRTPSDGASAASSVPNASATSVQNRMCSLPCMSPRRPRIGVATEAASRYAVSSQVTPVSVVCRLRSIVGSAGMTAELSTA